MAVFSYTPLPLSYQDSLLTIILAGLACHLVFKRYEPYNPLYLVGLLAVVPGLLTTLLWSHLSSGLSAVAITYAIYLCTLTTSIVCYRISPFHPLAKYPGPLVCKISKIWFANVAMGGKQHLYYQQLHNTYGDIVRIGPNELSFRDSAMTGQMMGSTGMPKGPFWDGRFCEQVHVRSMIGLRDPQEHARRRRPWNRAFNSAALKDYEGTIERRSLQLVEGLGKQAGTVDLTQWINYFTFDVINDIAFGGGSEMMRQGDTNGLWHLLDGALPTALLLSVLPWLQGLHMQFHILGTDLTAFRSYAQQRALMRRTQGSSTKDLFYYLIDEGGFEVTPPTTEEVVSDGALAIVAGSDTTSTALSNLFWLLISHPNAYARLRAEVDELDEDLLDTSRHARMPYLNAVINEALRLHPPVVSGSHRAPEKGSGGKSIGSHFLPEGTSAVMHFYSIHRDPRNFSPLPEAFLPERWLSHDQQIALEPELYKGSTNIAHNVSAFIPFSFGPSMCPGKALAFIEMRMVVCLLVRKYEMRFSQGFESKSYEDDLRDYFVTVKGSLPVVLSPRK